MTSKFKSLARMADTKAREGDRAEYWRGFSRGLRRAHHGEDFGDQGQHDAWMARDDDLGQGYRDGLVALGDPQPPLPSADDVLGYLRQRGITGAEAARMMYLSGSNQVRKYTGGASPRQMDLARWFCLHAHTMLPAETIASIEAAMAASAAEDADSGGIK